MRVRLAALAITALVVGGAESSLAAYVPRLVVIHEQGGVQVIFRQTLADDATGALFVYIPAGYETVFGQPPGTTIGQVSAQVEARAVAPGVPIALARGTVVTANPAEHSAIACRPFEVGIWTPVAVWVFSLPIPNQAEPLRIPVFVDGSSVTPGAYRLRACMPNPNVPESQGGARLGAKLLEVAFRLTNIRLSPGAPSEIRWAGLGVPYPPSELEADPARAVESRSLARTPGEVSLRATRVTRMRRSFRAYYARLTGAVTHSGEGVSGASIRITGGGRVRTLRTTGGGRFSLLVALRRTTAFRASTTVAERDVTASACEGATRPCVSATVAGFKDSSGSVRISPPRMNRKR
jgi:hypothetical protein